MIHLAIQISLELIAALKEFQRETSNHRNNPFHDSLVPTPTLIQLILVKLVLIFHRQMLGPKKGLMHYAILAYKSLARHKLTGTLQFIMRFRCSVM